MICLTEENTRKAIEKCKKLKPRVVFVAERRFQVQSVNNSNVYDVQFEVRGREKFGQCTCEASRKNMVCYHLIAGATANIYRQGLKRTA